MSVGAFDYVASDGSEWGVSLAVVEGLPWAVIEAHPRSGGLPVTYTVDEAAFGPHVIAEVIAHINERCAPCL
jgi:hypothetical protein